MCAGLKTSTAIMANRLAGSPCWGYGSLVEYLPSMHKAWVLSLIPKQICTQSTHPSDPLLSDTQREHSIPPHDIISQNSYDMELPKFS